MNNPRYLEVSRVSKAYGSQVIVKDFDLMMAKGEFVSVIGHSGCGKSTVLSMIAGLTPSSGGGIILAGKEVCEPGPDRGVVFQSPSLFPWMTALQNVLIGVEQVRPKESRSEREAIAVHYLTLVGLGEALHKRPTELSSGMRQRVGLARAFALTPNLLLLDEPFGMLDSLTRLELQDVLIELLAQDGRSALMVTHDVDEALFLSDRIVMMTPGPEACVGEILSVPFARPRNRKAVLTDPNYYVLRERVIGFLESQHGPSHAATEAQPEAVPEAAAHPDSLVVSTYQATSLR